MKNTAIDTTSINTLVLEKRSKIIAKGNYSLSGTVFLDGSNSLYLSYNFYHYSGSNETGAYDNREHFYLTNVVRNDGELTSYTTSDLINTRFDQWIKEKITVDYVNRKMIYTITDDDGNNLETLQLNDIILERKRNTEIILSAWDWANGSQHIVDDLKIYSNN